MYRALTLKAIRRQVNLQDEAALIQLAQQSNIDLRGHPPHELRVFLDGEDVTLKIREQEVTAKTFYIARTAGVREVMVRWQRAISEKRNTVVEGRDTGTIVFPQADLKIYLDADFEERVRRRFRDLQALGQAVELRNLKKELKDRDKKDLTRQMGPLKKAEDAVVLDSTRLSVDQVVDRILGLWQGHKVQG